MEPVETASPMQVAAADAKRTVRNIGALVVASVFSKGLLFLWQIVLAPWLGTTTYGVYNTVIALTAIGAVVTNFGIGMIAIREIARKPEKIGSYWTSMLFTQTLLAGIAYAGVTIAAVTVYSPAIQAYTALAGLSIIIDIFGSIANDLLLSQERMVATSIVDVVNIFVRIGLALLFLMMGWGLTGVFLAAILSGIGRSSALCWLNLRQGVHPHFPLDWSVTVPLFMNSLPLAASAFLTLLYQNTDKLMTTAIIGETNTGYLGPAFVISFGVIEVLSTTVLVAVYPMMSRYYDGDKSETFGFIVEKLALFMGILSLPIALILSIFAPEIIAFIYRSGEFAPTAGILSILIWYTMLTMVVNVFAQGLMVQNRQRLMLFIRAGGFALNVAMNAYLLSRYHDPRGAAAASVVAELLVLTLLARFFRANGLDWSRAGGAGLRLAVVGIMAAVIMLLLHDVQVILAGTVGLLLYAAGILFTRILKDEDWDLLYRLVAAVPGGSFIRRYWKRTTQINW